MQFGRHVYLCVMFHWIIKTPTKNTFSSAIWGLNPPFSQFRFCKNTVGQEKSCWNKSWWYWKVSARYVLPQQYTSYITDLRFFKVLNIPEVRKKWRREIHLQFFMQLTRQYWQMFDMEYGASYFTVRTACFVRLSVGILGCLSVCPVVCQCKDWQRAWGCK